MEIRYQNGVPVAVLSPPDGTGLVTIGTFADVVTVDETTLQDSPPVAAVADANAAGTAVSGTAAVVSDDGTLVERTDAANIDGSVVAPPAAQAAATESDADLAAGEDATELTQAQAAVSALEAIGVGNTDADGVVLTAGNLVTPDVIDYWQQRVVSLQSEVATDSELAGGADEAAAPETAAS